MNSLDLDLSIYKSDIRNSLNIFSNRAGFIQENGYIDIKDIYLEPNAFSNINDLILLRTTVIYSRWPIKIEVKVGDDTTATTFLNQTLWIVSGDLSEIKVTNTSSSKTTVKIIRLAEPQIIEVPDLMTRQLITFSALSRVAQLPLAVVNLSNVKVQSVTLFDWTNDQVTQPGTGLQVLNKFRICNSDGSPNPTGQYIMILNDNISQQNFSGTLQLWVEEIGSSGIS